MAAKLKTAVLGSTGYSGLELVRLLGRHPRTEAPLLLRRNAETKTATETDEHAAGLPHISGTGTDNANGNSPAQPFSWSALEQHGVELLFLATPHALSRELVTEAMSRGLMTRGLRVVDLSGAWRLKQEQHRAVYGFKDANAQTAAELTERAVYGLPELNADQIPSAALVANPGCYATSIILALAPSQSTMPADSKGASARIRRRVRTSCRWPTTFPHTLSSDTATPARYWS